MFRVKGRKAADAQETDEQRKERERAVIEAKLKEEKEKREKEKLAKEEAEKEKQLAAEEAERQRIADEAERERQNAEHEKVIDALTVKYAKHPVTAKIAGNFEEYIKSIESRYYTGSKNAARVTIYANFTCRAFLFEAEKCVYDDYGEVSRPERVGDTVSTTFYRLGIKDLASADDVIALCRAVVSLIDYHPEKSHIACCLRLGKAYEQYRQSVVFDFTNPPVLSKDDLMDW